jgi:DNA gyrase inhibitor GyrI
VTARIVAYPADRERLLANGEMAMPVYSSDPERTARESYRTMTCAADLMDIQLSEPFITVGPADGTGRRIVTVKCGCWDKPQQQEGQP